MTTLKQILNKGNSFSCELVTYNHESVYSFEWNTTDRTSPIGYSHFKKVLSSEVKLLGGNIVLTDDKITQQELNEFCGAVAGYCSLKDYNAWFCAEVT